MSLTRLKNSIIRKAVEEWGGLAEERDYAPNNRYGRISPAQMARWRRVTAAFKELVAEGRLEPTGYSSYRVVES